MHNLSNVAAFVAVAAVILGLIFCVASLWDEVDMLRGESEDDHVDASF